MNPANPDIPQITTAEIMLELASKNIVSLSEKCAQLENERRRLEKEVSILTAQIATFAK